MGLGVCTYWQTLHEKIRRKRPNQESYVENTAEPAILCTMEVEVFLDAKDGRIAQSRLTIVVSIHQPDRTS